MTFNQQDYEQQVIEQGHYRQQINDKQTPRHQIYYQAQDKGLLSLLATVLYW